MGNFHSIRTRFLGLRTPDEEEGGSPAYPYLQNQHKSNGDSSLEILLFFGSIYKAIKAILQKLVVSTKAADPSLPIHEPLLAPTPQICSRGDSSSHSLSVDTVGSLTGLISGIDDEDAQYENVGRCKMYWADRNEIDRDHVVSVAEIRCSNEIQVEISPCLEKKSSRKARGRVKRSIAAVEREKRIKHYSSRHNILLVGEGDFSFSACLARALGSAAKVIATSLDSQEFLKKNYGNAVSNIAELRRRAGKVMHGIDATKMANHELLRQLKFDRIIYNFPYAGIFDKSVPKESQLSRHRKLVSKFLMNARNMLIENGEIHITHKTNGFHTDFKVESIASSHGLRLIEAVRFERGDYPGYNTKYGFGGDANFDCNPSKTFKFGFKLVSL
ncbi:25S rRNA (uracil(2634)-N(3))-methyltransferase [Salvia divinorum]|uniref:25S rRNA (Uracil(2634)-N(3))-methyltransferase n=1 Tax=Salvia divinorum TaxID=28513 RepID=A0ABD1HIV4_SALDI